MLPREEHHYRTVRRLVTAARSYWNQQEFYPRSGNAVDHVVLALVSKSLRVADAVMHLVRAGYSDEAFGLTRTLVEIALNLRYITNRSSDYRARRFIAYGAKWKLELARRYARNHNDFKLSSLPQYRIIRRDARRFPKNASSWLDGRKPRRGQPRGARRLALELDRQRQASPEQPPTWQFDYSWIYFWTSEYVHASVTALESHLSDESAPFRVQAAPGSSGNTGAMATFNVAFYVNRILARALFVLGREYPDRLSHPLRSVIESMNGQ